MNLLEQLFGTVLVPLAVAKEVAPTVTLSPWVKEQAPTQPVGPQILAASLGPGESEALGSALELEARRIILDERPARRLSGALGIPTVGTLGGLLSANRRNLILALKPHLDALLQHDFRISAALYEQVLGEAGEPP